MTRVRNHNRVFVLRIGKRKKGRETFFKFFIVMFVTPKRDDDDVNDAEEEEEEHRTLENRGEEKKSYSAAEGRENVPGRTRNRRLFCSS